MKTQRNESRRAFSQNKGSILLTAVIFATISLVIVGSFLKLTKHELRLSNHQFYSNQALNLAEAGLDEAMHYLHSKNPDGWNVDDDADEARFTATDISSGSGATGEIHVLLEDGTGLNPIVISEGRVTSGTGMTITKQLKMSLRPRSYFANGITAQCKVVFKGGVSSVESYQSSTGLYPPAHVVRDNAAVATTSLQMDLVVGGAKILGYAFTGGGDIKVGGQGYVHGLNSPSSPAVDPKRVARDFTANFPKALEPVGTPTPLPAITTSMELGTPGNMTMFYSTPSINMNGGELKINGPVVLEVEGNADFKGGARLVVGNDTTNAENAKILFYAGGNFTVGGTAGMTDRTMIPNNLAIFGMGAESPLCSFSQSFVLGGTASWAALVYAPNADIELNGGGSDGIMTGAVVGMNVTVNGNSHFYYDEDVQSFLEGFGWVMDSWEEVPKVSQIQFD